MNISLTQITLTAISHVLLAGFAQAAITYSDDFDTGLKPEWSILSTTGVASGNTVGGALNILADTDTGATAERIYANSTLLSTASDWTVQVDIHMGQVSDFINPVDYADGLVLSTLNLNAIDDEEDQFTFNAALLDATIFGSTLTHGFRVNGRIDDSSTQETFDFLGTELPGLDVTFYISYLAATQSLYAAYDMGSGLVLLGAPELISTWNSASGIEVRLEGRLSSVQTTPPAGIIAEEGDLTFDNFIIQDVAVIPESSNAALVTGLGAALLMINRRRRAA